MADDELRLVHAVQKNGVPKRLSKFL